MNVIEIFFDTNAIRPSLKNYVDFHLNNTFSDFVDFIGSKDLIENCSINICQIVFLEIQKQITDEFYKNVEVLRYFPSITEDSYKREKEFIVHLKEKIDEYVENNHINIIKIPTSEESYLKIIDRAVNKKKPFVGDKGDSDKGFKDAIQWDTIIEYSKQVSSEHFILITDNKSDFDSTLEKEFRDITEKNIKIFTSIGEAQDYILKINNMHSNYNFVNKLIGKMFAEGTLLSFVEDKITEREYEIDNIESVDNVVDLGNNLYEFNLYVDDEHQMFYTVECQLIDDTLINTDIIICL